jgi:hypothetical protein
VVVVVVVVLVVVLVVLEGKQCNRYYTDCSARCGDGGSKGRNK